MKKKLEEKNDEVFKKMKEFVINELDLDNYNITSEDFSYMNTSAKNTQRKIKK